MNFQVKIKRRFAVYSTNKLLFGILSGIGLGWLSFGLVRHSLVEQRALKVSPLLRLSGPGAGALDGL